MSFQEFIRALTSAVPDITAEEIADALWLAPQIPPGLFLTAQRPTEQDLAADTSGSPVRPAARQAGAQEGSGIAGHPPGIASRGIGRLGYGGVQRDTGTGADGINGGKGALSARPAGMPQQLDFARALRPLKRTVPSRSHVALDEQATADQVAHRGLWLPFLRAAPERQFDVALVVDDGPSMAIWMRTVSEFRMMLESTGAFRDVRVWWLNSDAHMGNAFMLRSDAPAEQTIARSPWELPDPSRRRLILVLSDGIGRAWRDRRMSRMLKEWAHAGHVSIVQPLPQRLWHRCATAVAAVSIQATEPGMENSRFSIRYRHVTDPGPGYRHAYGEQPSAKDGVPIPVLNLEPRWLARWAQLVVGAADWSDMPVLFTGRVTYLDRFPALAVRPRDRVTRFRASASREAFQLAGYLAFAPVTLPIMRLVQETMLPASQTVHLAEVLLGGLLTRDGPAESPPTDDEPSVVYEFHRGVREILHSTVPRSTGLRVLRQVSRYIADRAGRPVNFPELIESPNQSDLAALAEADQRFARVARSALRGLDGRYAVVADMLGEVLGPSAPQVIGHGRVPAPARALTEGSVPWSLGREPRFDEPVPIDPGQFHPPAQPSFRGDDVSYPPNERPARRRRGELPAIWIGIPPRNPYFSGREDLLRDIHERLTSKVTALVPHTLHGYGGVGKTHLAIEYAYRYQSEYDLVCWLSAEQPAMVRAGIADLAKRMNLPSLTVDDAVRSVLAALRQGYPYERWLLVFDNANHPQDFEDFFPSGSGHILLTSRNDVWAGTARVIEVDVFPRRESIEFLRGRLGEEAITVRDADLLAERLDDLPLALEQAAAWQAETGTRVQDYLVLFDDRMAHLRDVAAVREQVRPTGYPLTVAVTWSLALDRLREAQPEVVQLLQLCAFFAPEPIPWNLFSVGRYVGELPAELRRAIRSNRDRDRMIREIKKYALAQVDYGTSRLQLHRLAQMVLREQLASDDQRAEVRHQAHMLIAAADPGDPDIPANWERYRELWPHVEPSGSMECTDREVRELVLNLTRYLYVQGSYDAGLDFAQTTLDSWEERFPQDQDTLILIRHLATILRALGHTDEAGNRSMESYEKLRAVYGDDDEETLSAGNLVGGSYRDLGKFERALQLDEDLHRRHLRVFGPEHPRTLMSANNQALDYFLMGDYDKATAIDDQVLQTRRQVLGDTNPFTLCSEYSYARDRREAGHYLQARNQLELTLTRYTIALGEIHPDTLRAAKHLAVARRKVGDYERARELSELTFSAYQSRLGGAHPDTLSAAQNLVNDLRLTRDFNDAANLGEETLQEYRRVLGEKHPFTLLAENNYAIALRQCERLEEARERSLSAFEGLKEALGDTHPYTLSAATTYANDLHATGDFPQALEILDVTYTAFKATLGKQHPYTLACGVNLIEELHANGNDENAELLGDAVKERYALVLGEDHPEVIAGRTEGVRGECSTDAPHT